jgi:hypothetical protein
VRVPHVLQICARKSSGCPITLPFSSDKASLEAAGAEIDKWIPILTAALTVAMGTDTIAAVKAETDRSLSELEGLLSKALANVSSEVRCLSRLRVEADLDASRSAPFGQVRTVGDKVDDVKSDLAVLKEKVTMSSSAAAAKRILLSDIRGIDTPASRVFLGSGRSGAVFKAQ